MAPMKFYTEEEALDMTLGTKGTPVRDKYEEEMDNFRIGDAIRQTRTSKHMTQEQLGELMGVKRAQISKLENGKSEITLPTMRRVFKALGVKSASLDLGEAGRIALW